MIITEPYLTREDGVELVRTYSTKNLKIKQLSTNIIYDEAIDVSPLRYTYEETDIPIQDEEATPEELLSILLGGVE